MKKWLFPIDKVNQQSGHNTTKETGNYAHGQHGFTQSGTINAHLHRLWDQIFRFFILKCHFIWIPQYTLRLKAVFKSREKFVLLAKLVGTVARKVWFAVYDSAHCRKRHWIKGRYISNILFHTQFLQKEISCINLNKRIPTAAKANFFSVLQRQRPIAGFNSLD